MLVLFVDKVLVILILKNSLHAPFSHCHSLSLAFSRPQYEQPTPLAPEKLSSSERADQVP
jgi:hypothetical protein